MVRAGLFEDADVVLHWHAGDRNAANPATSLANKSARVRFYGQSAHAAAAPERGRSALDGVEAMTFMVNLMREHVPERTRMHYVITSGGKAPNVVPDFAEVYLYVRHPEASVLAGLWDRVLDTAQAAALGTGTEVELEVMHGNHALLPNETLARAMHRNLSAVGGYRTARRSSLSPSPSRKALAIDPASWAWSRRCFPLLASMAARGARTSGTSAGSSPPRDCARPPGCRAPRLTAGRPSPPAAPPSA